MIYQIIHNFTPGIGGAETVVSTMFNSNFISESNADNLDSELTEIELIGICNTASESQGNVIGWGIKKIYSIHAFTSIWNWIKSLKKNALVHSHLFPTGLYVSLAIRFAGRKDLTHIYTEHSTNNKRRNSIYGKWIDSVMYSGINRVVCVSQGVKSELILAYPQLAQKSLVIYNGIANNVNVNDTSDLNSKDGLINQITQEDLVILSVGRLVASKNYSRSLFVISELKKMGISIKYFIAGSSEFSSSNQLEIELKQQVSKLQIQNDVIFLGYVSPVYPIYKQVDLFFAYSVYEGFGLAALEAMSAGVPVVFSNVLGLKELIPENYPEELIVSPFSIEDAVNAIHWFYNCNISVRKFIGDSCRQKAKQFTIENSIKKHFSLYKEFQK